jgi:site-specific recombinase XerC
MSRSNTKGVAPSQKITANDVRELFAQAQRFIDAIEPRKISNIRDRAIIGMMGYALASVDNILKIRVQDYYSLGECYWVRFMENGAERCELATPKLENLMEEYLKSAGIENEPWTPLFRSTLSGNGRIAARAVSRQHIINLINNCISNDQTNITQDQARKLLRAIKSRGVINLRDRAIIGLILYVSASPSAVAAMRIGDYELRNGQYWVHSSREEAVTVPSPLVAIMGDYLAAIPWRTDSGSPLFRIGRAQSIRPSHIREMIAHRTRVSGAASDNAAGLG